MSGEGKEARGCLLERTWRGTEPLALPSRRGAALPGGRRRGDPARPLRARGLRPHRLRRVPGRGDGVRTARRRDAARSRWALESMTSGGRRMAKVESLGIKRLESVHYYVHDLERSRRFYTEVMDFAEIGESSEELTRAGRQKSLAFLAGNCVVVCIEPRGEGGRAWRWLRKHPDGVGTLNFEVEDVAEDVSPPRGARGDADRRRPAVHATTRGHEIAFFSITTPFGDTTFRFVERHGYRALYPGFEMHDAAAGRGEPPRLRGLRPHHLELPHPRPRGPVARARDGLRALLGDPVPHDRRGPGPPEGLRAALARVPGPRLGREVREQRALAAQLPQLADQHLQRGAAGAPASSTSRSR